MVTVTIMSYGARYCHYNNEIEYRVEDAERVFSCHEIRNPFSVKGMRELSGLDSKIQTFIWSDTSSRTIYEEAILSVEEGARKIAFECYGGKHRSVAMAEIVAEGLRDLGYVVTTEHLTIGG